MPETIIALATPPGISALSILRLSGPHCRELTDQLVDRPVSWESHRFYRRRLILNGEILDDVVMSFSQAPQSYTGEDTLEITCHGNPLIVQRILQTYLSLGAQVSQPGEFTQRAFLNGKIDLAQAESVVEVIEAATPQALRGAQAILEGALGTRMGILRTRLIDLLANLEAYIDFPDEDIKPETGQQFLRSVELTQAEVRELIASAPLGKILREGVATVIIGSPNVGKSSLFNALVKSDRAIVSSIPGTTRDLIEESCNVGGFHLRLIDTAGQRETGDSIEAEGVRRAQNALSRADLVLYVVDGSRPAGTDSLSPPVPLPHQHFIAIAHKADLGVHLDHQTKLAVSSKTGLGLQELERTIRMKLSQGKNLEQQGWLTVNARQESALRQADQALQLSWEGLQRSDPPELVSSRLREALHAIGEVVGLATNEDILDALFKKFCIGK